MSSVIRINFDRVRAICVRKDALVREHIGTPKHVCEVGVGAPGYCHAHTWIGKTKVTLIDANPHCCERCQAAWASRVTVVNAAIVAAHLPCSNGVARLMVPAGRGSRPFNRGSLEGVESPAQQQGEDEHLRPVVSSPTRLFSELDPGDIDYLTIDVKGSEWAVLQTMVSRPKVLCCEMVHLGKYENAYRLEIMKWMKDNNYMLHLYVGADWCWVKQ